MRTTLTIDTDVLSAARDLAARQHSTIGTVISELARRSLANPQVSGSQADAAMFGITPLPRRGVVVSNDMVNAIRDDENI